MSTFIYSGSNGICALAHSAVNVAARTVYEAVHEAIRATEIWGCEVSVLEAETLKRVAKTRWHVDCITVHYEPGWEVEDFTLCLDLCPYRAQHDAGRRRIAVFGIQNSILGKLDNRASVTENRFSEDHYIAEVNDLEWYVETCAEDESDETNIVFEYHRDEPDPVVELIQWITRNWDRIQSIGYEALNTR